jgi:WD40 repeat protein
VHLARLSPDAGCVLLAYAERANLFDLALDRDIASIRHDDNLNLCHVVFSPDGLRAATAEKDQTIRVWDIDAMRERSILRGHRDAISSLAWSRDGRILASAYAAGRRDS